MYDQLQPFYLLELFDHAAGYEENDRVRYTVSTEARKEILLRLLALNHERHAEEVTAREKAQAEPKPAAQKKPGMKVGKGKGHGPELGL